MARSLWFSQKCKCKDGMINLKFKQNEIVIVPYEDKLLDLLKKMIGCRVCLLRTGLDDHPQYRAKYDGIYPYKNLQKMRGLR
jgi:hypothetical protein